MTSTAFESCALACLDGLLGYACHLTRNRDEAEELVQEAYARVLTYRDHVERPEEARPLLFRILHNLFVDRYRARQRGPMMISVEEIEGQPEACTNHLVDESTPLTELTRKCLSDEMSDALKSLDQGLRETLCLRELEGFSYEEIGEILEIPVGTVRSRLFRARRAMARQLTSPTFRRHKNVAASDPPSEPHLKKRGTS